MRTTCAAQGRGRTAQLLPRIVRNRPLRRLFCVANMGAFAAVGQIYPSVSIWAGSRPVGEPFHPALRVGDAAIFPGCGRQGSGASKLLDADCACYRAHRDGLLDVILQYLRTYTLSHTTVD